MRAAGAFHVFELHDVWKSPGKAGSQGEWTLAGATVSFPAGLRVALLGSDRTTNSAVLRVLSGVEAPDSGAIRRVGTACWPLDYSQFLDNKGTVSQNANFIGHVYGVDPSEVLRITTRLCSVKISRGKLLSQYLSVDRKGIALGLTLSLQFDWYFIDEMIPRNRFVSADVEAVIENRLSHASVIWSTTNPDTLKDYCNAALLLDRGTLAFYDDFGEAADAFRRINEAKTLDEAKSRKAGRRGRSARRQSEVDPENAG